MLNQMQQLIQDIYELDIDHNIYDYLITNNRLAQQLRSSESVRQPQEQLFIAQENNELNISLYLDEGVVGRLQQNNPLDHLGHHNIQDCCLALEGISHFIYVIWNASHDRPVTQLELELQAEVDKFIALASVCARTGTTAPDQLHKILFCNTRYDDDLSDEESRRYYLANMLAAHYCMKLQESYLNPGKTAAMTRELRRFYRLTQKNKLLRINLSS